MMLGGQDESTVSQRIAQLNKDFNKATALANASNYTAAECGLVHPLKSSMVKLRDNGCIDIFVGTDNGIRIDPENKSINIIGSALKEHIGTLHSWISESAVIEVTGPWTLKAIDINVEASKSINLKGLDINLAASSTLTIKAGKVSATAGRYDWN